MHFIIYFGLVRHWRFRGRISENIRGPGNQVGVRNSFYSRQAPVGMCGLLLSSKREAHQSWQMQLAMHSDWLISVSQVQSEVYDEWKWDRQRLRRCIATIVEPPMFPIELWNIHSRQIEGLPRTNNFAEAWHGAFSATLTSQPSVYKLVSALRTEQKRTENWLTKIDTGLSQDRQLW